MDAKEAILTVFDECGIFPNERDDAKTILMRAFDEAGIFTTDDADAIGWASKYPGSFGNPECKSKRREGCVRHKTGIYVQVGSPFGFKDEASREKAIEESRSSGVDVDDPQKDEEEAQATESDKIDILSGESPEAHFLEDPGTSAKESPEKGSLTEGAIFDIIRNAINARKDFENGKRPRISQRVPEAALRVRDEGTRTLAEASLVCRATEGAGNEGAGNNGSRPTRGEGETEGGFRPVGSSREASKIQERLIEAYAKSKGIWEDDADLRMKNTPEFPEYTEGGETMVFFPAEAGRPLTKLITSSYFPETVQLLDRIALHNYLFPDSALTVKGFGRTHADWSDNASNPMFAVKVEQPSIDTSMPATEEQVAAHMKSLGFREHKRLANDDVVWESEDGRFVVSDLTEENVFVDGEGNVRVIDANIQLNTPGSDGSGRYRMPPIKG